MPQTKGADWQAKIARNIARDSASLASWRKLGWKPAVIWECETRDAPTPARLITRRVRQARQA